MHMAIEELVTEIFILNRRLATQDKSIVANQPCYSEDRRIVWFKWRNI